MELDLLFLVGNGKSDHSVLKFKEQHTSDAAVAQSYSEHASQDMTWLSAAVESWLTHDCTAIGHRLGFHMLRIYDVNSSNGFTEDVSRRLQAVVRRSHYDQLIRYNFVNNQNVQTVQNAVLLVLLQKVSPTSSCRVDQALYSKAQLATWYDVSLFTEYY